MSELVNQNSSGNKEIETLKIELEILNKIYLNFKNHLKSSILIGRINEVRKLTVCFIKTKTMKSKLKDKSLELYVASSNIYSMKHYQSLCILLFGLSSRIYKCVDSTKEL